MSHLQNTDLTIKYLDEAFTGITSVKKKLREIQQRNADNDLTIDQESTKQAVVDEIFDSLRDELVPTLTSIRNAEVPWGADLQPFVMSPNLIGLTEEDAILAIENAGFPTPSIRNKNSDTETDGLVYVQTPEADVEVDGTSVFYIEVAVNPV